MIDQPDESYNYTRAEVKQNFLIFLIVAAFFAGMFVAPSPNITNTEIIKEIISCTQNDAIDAIAVILEDTHDYDYNPAWMVPSIKPEE